MKKRSGRPLGYKTKPRDNSLKVITPKVVRAMKDLHIFNAHTLLAKLKHMYCDDAIVRRRTYDISGVLLGAGMISIHPQDRKTYVFEGLSGVAARLKKLREHPKMNCPFGEFKQLRTMGWECVRLFARNPRPRYDEFIGVCGTRRIYDVDSVLRGAGVLDVATEKWRLHPYFYPKEEEKQEERIALKVSDKDVADLFGLDLENNKEIFIFYYAPISSSSFDILVTIK